MHRVVVVAPASDPVVTTADARAHCHVAHTGHDAYLAGLVAAAAAWLEGPTGWLGRSLLTRTLRQDMPGFPVLSGYTPLSLRAGPVTAVTSVTYVDDGNAVQTLPGADYFLVPGGDALMFVEGFCPPATYVRPDAVRVTYTAGYADAAAIPPPIRHAILLLVSHWYENREAVTIGQAPAALPMAVEALLAPWRLL